MNIEAKIIEYLASALEGIPVSADVPADRPASFVTVERTGGGLQGVVVDTADIAIQSWAGTRHEASLLSDLVDTAMQRIVCVEGITRVSRDTIYNFPPPGYSMARYQGYYEVKFYKEYGS